MTGSAPCTTAPGLSPDEWWHSQAVIGLIRAEIAAAGGVIPFERYMERALYAPGFGYYSAGSTKFGVGGDFVTAPEISDMFGRCVAVQCAQILAQTGGEILEIGAGSGRLAATVLQALAASDALPERYGILEVSADLAERQRALLSTLPAKLAARVEWLERLPDKPIRGVLLANEVVDALPVSRFVLRGGALRELGVALADESVATNSRPFVEREMVPGAALSAAWNAMMPDLPQSLPDGYRSELCLRVAPWVAALGASLERGVILLFDYGLPRAHYYHPQRTDGTLRCFCKHRALDDPFMNVGVQDITAWVDFTRVAAAAADADLQVLSFTTQAAFLLATGIGQFIAEATDNLERVRHAAAARKLLMPGEMGEAFKVMALGRNYGSALQGFAVQDLRRYL